MRMECQENLLAQESESKEQREYQKNLSNQESESNNAIAKWITLMWIRSPATQATTGSKSTLEDLKTELGEV